MDITEIRHQALSTIYGDFYVCQSCRVVDRERGRASRSFACPRCGSVNGSAEVYLNLSVLGMLDLLQEALHSEPVVPHSIFTDRRSDVLAVLHFCTLREALLSDLLRQLMRSRGVSPEEINKTLEQHRTRHSRTQRLFPRLSDMSWSDALATVDAGAELNYQETESFYQDMARRRNFLVHEGNLWATRDGLAEACLRNCWPTLNLFVAVHNLLLARPLAT